MSLQKKKASRSEPVLPIERMILVVRNERVILDRDLASLYGVTTSALNQAVVRNAGRFPEDFSFLLNNKEVANLKSQNVISSSGHGGRRTAPQAFTEHGAIMAANVLRSDRAVKMSVFVVRAFVKLREMVATNARLSAKLRELEQRVDTHDQALSDIIATIRELVEPFVEDRKKRRIGFNQS